MTSVPYKQEPFGAVIRKEDSRGKDGAEEGHTVGMLLIRHGSFLVL